MEEILHQFISSFSHYLQGFYTSQVVVWDFHQQTSLHLGNNLASVFLSKRYMNLIWMETDSKISENLQLTGKKNSWCFLFAIW